MGDCRDFNGGVAAVVAAVVAAMEADMEVMVETRTDVFFILLLGTRLGTAMAAVKKKRK